MYQRVSMRNELGMSILKRIASPVDSTHASRCDKSQFPLLPTDTLLDRKAPAREAHKFHATAGHAATTLSHDALV